MAKTCELRWVPGETIPGANWNASWGWRLLPLTNMAHTFATQALSDASSGWVDGIQACADRRDVFFFRDRNGNLEAAKKSLSDAGFREEEIEVVGDKPSNVNTASC